MRDVTEFVWQMVLLAVSDNLLDFTFKKVWIQIKDNIIGQCFMIIRARSMDAGRMDKLSICSLPLDFWKKNQNYIRI
jgi:hypothetical protein